MSYETDITAAILANAPLTALIGGRFAWDTIEPKQAGPYIVAQTATDGSEPCMDGSRELAFPLLQFSCWASGKVAVIELAKALSAALEGGGLPGDSHVSLIFTDEQSTFDRETRLHGKILEYRAASLTTA